MTLKESREKGKLPEFIKEQQKFLAENKLKPKPRKFKKVVNSMELADSQSSAGRKSSQARENIDFGFCRERYSNTLAYFSMFARDVNVSSLNGIFEVLPKRFQRIHVAPVARVFLREWSTVSVSVAKLRQGLVSIPSVTVDCGNNATETITQYGIEQQVTIVR